MSSNNCPNLLADRSFLDRQLSSLQSTNLTVAQPAADEYCTALDAYLELPSLLDPIVPTHITTLANVIHSRLADISNPAVASSLTTLSRSLYTLIKVRGPKRVTLHFPHQVHHLRQLLPILSDVESNPTFHSLWHLRYVLYMWISVAIRVPFPLNTILTPDSLTDSIKRAQTALVDTGPVSQAATAYLAHFLSRRDAVHHRASLIHHLITNSLIPKATPSASTAALALLASVFKHAHRDDLQPHVHPILRAIPHPDTTSTTTQAHLVTKLSHRLALSFLPPRPAAWRYTRPLPVLRQAPGHTGLVEPQIQTHLSDADAEALEQILDLLLIGLRERDTVVRWSAAKGIGRITARLPRELAMDVIDAVLAVFDDVQQARSDAAWHGACLAIAELARRGLLLPADQHFRDAFNAIDKAASFDVRRGAISVGAHVRDAACYAIWAVARAYAKEDVAVFAPFITKSMLPLALLDREVNCRRAAAAALQECVGRLSPELFVDGIKLITLAEYFTLGDRNAAYLTIAPQVAQIGGGIHFDAIVEQLWKQKLVHWDPAVRTLAAKALARFVDVDKDGTIVNQVLPALVSMAKRKGDMVYRHGAVLGISEIAKVVGYKGLQSLRAEIRNIPVSTALLIETHQTWQLERCSNRVPATQLSILQKLLHMDKLLTGRTADDMRIACCQLIESLATGAVDVYLDVDCGRTAAEEALKFLETILGCGKEQLYAPATSAYTAVCENVIANDKQWHVKITMRILDGISRDSFSEHQRGFALAAGACGDSEISNEVTTILCEESRINKDVEVRRNCVTSLGTVGLRAGKERLADVLHGFAGAMEDYATDDRGDIGSWVREASMQSCSKVLRSVFEKKTSQSFLDEKTEDAMMVVVNRVIEQCCSKIDRTRGVAGQALRDICGVVGEEGEHGNRVSALCAKLLKVFNLSPKADSPTWVTFVESVEAFGVMKKTLLIPEIARSAIRGFVSAGGGMGLQASYACDSMACHLNEKEELCMEEAELGEIGRIIESREERLVLPALRILDYLLKRGVLRRLEDRDLKVLVRIVKQSWRNGLRNVKLTSAAVGVLCEIASQSGSRYSFEFEEESVGRDCLEGLAIILGGPLPRLRRIAAENLYMILLEVDKGSGGTVETGMEILVDTSWEKMKIGEARRRRNELCERLGIRTPTAAKKAF